MKQILMILILVVTSYGGIIAQDLKNIDCQFDLGTTFTIPYKTSIKIWTDLNDNPQADYNSDFGYFLEYLISYNLNSKYAISTGLNYNYSSIKINDHIGFLENKGKMTNSYLTVPILFKYNQTKNLPISISAGPYLGFLVNANENITSYIDTNSQYYTKLDPEFRNEPPKKYNTDIKKYYASIDYGLSVQLEYEIKINQKLKGLILTRLNYGFKNALTDYLEKNSFARKWKNYNLMIGFGLKL